MDVRLSALGTVDDDDTTIFVGGAASYEEVLTSVLNIAALKDSFPSPDLISSTSWPFLSIFKFSKPFLLDVSAFICQTYWMTMRAGTTGTG